MYHILYVIVFLCSLPRPSIDIQSNDALVILLQGSIVLQFVLALIGTTSSLISVFYLLKHKNITSPTTSHNAHLHQKKKKSCNTLLLMNIPYFAVLILALICLKRIEKFDGTFDLMHVIYTVVYPAVSAMCDPLVLLRKESYWRTILKMLGLEQHRCRGAISPLTVNTEF